MPADQQPQLKQQNHNSSWGTGWVVWEWWSFSSDFWEWVNQVLQPSTAGCQDVSSSARVSHSEEHVLHGTGPLLWKEWHKELSTTSSLHMGMFAGSWSWVLASAQIPLAGTVLCSPFCRQGTSVNIHGLMGLESATYKPDYIWILTSSFGLFIGNAIKFRLTSFFHRNMFKNCSLKKTSCENLSQVLALPWDYHRAALLVLLPRGWCLRLWAHSGWQEKHCALQLPALTQLWERSHVKPFSAGICCFPLSKGFCRMRAIPNSQAFCSHPYQSQTLLWLPEALQQVWGSAHVLCHVLAACPACKATRQVRNQHTATFLSASPCHPLCCIL